MELKNKLLKIVTAFREGLLDNKPSKSMCVVVSSALESYLCFEGYQCEITMGKIDINKDEYEHTWLTLPSGEIIDATADQFSKPDGTGMPPVYIGRKPVWYKQPPAIVFEVRSVQ